MSEDALSTIFETSPDDLLKSVDAQVRHLEVGADSPAAGAVRSIIQQSREVFTRRARPRGMWQPISIPDFDGLYPGEGQNDEDTPLEYVIEGAVSLALFAATLGDEISERINDLFVGGELAEAYILDQLASFAADHLAQIAGENFRTEDGREDLPVLPYSPGYCGWHVSGQRALFARLEPRAIGITLNDSCLMQPLKSVSGVLVLAPIEAHTFSPSFPCCASCTTLDCQDRVASLRSVGS